MALSKGTNSYATVDEADAYFADRLDVAAWTAADATQKAQALVTATGVLDDLTWAGTAISEEQELAFPRSLEYFDPKVGAVVFLDGSETPQRVIRATYELAYHLLNNDGLRDETGTVDQISVGSINLSNIKKAATIPGTVNKLIRPLLVNSGASTWWRAN